MTDPADTGGQAAPRWLMVVAIVALAWNLLGFAALAMDALNAGTALPEAQAVYAATVPLWAQAASWIAVGAGIAGCLLILRRQARAVVAFAVSLIALIVQDAWLFVLSGAQAVFGPTPLVMQAMVAAIAVGLLWLANHARTNGWIR